jgi:hypothetical protein
LLGCGLRRRELAELLLDQLFVKLPRKGQHQRKNFVNISKLLHVVQVLHYLYLEL